MEKEGKRERGRLTSLVGRVVRNSADKTAVVDVVRMTRHPVYNKSIKKRVRYMVHDEKNQCEIGDTALIYESRPVSKLKRWKLGKIARKAQSASGAGVTETP